MRFFAAAVLLAAIAIPAHASTEADVRRIYAECSYWDADEYPGAVERWVGRIEAGQWSLHALAGWGLEMVRHVHKRPFEEWRKDRRNPEKRAAALAAGREIKRMVDQCDQRQYRGR